ncbi:class I SAM-dependent methyltransferase [Nesterenkonia ebinurensis]|uniref:class I SAM-dependent methyltransferase n=1 Tax=Nesterenkonia ebinurensis TaxID=2608252 RepID=UPI001CC3F884|nr:SAM-dependent methyltransferase [Nesterenkonia ebinurensis]
MPGAIPDPIRPLLSPETWELLNSLPEYRRQGADEMNITLRKQGWPAETVAAVLTQLRLRARAKTKFGEFAARMLFTEAGLQQSTRLPVAARHARRFREAGVRRVADLGCGLGADSLAFASAGLAVTAVEADETTAAAAYLNLRPFPEAQVVHSTAEDWAAEHLEVLSAYFVQHSGAESGRNAAQIMHSTEKVGSWGLWLDPARRNERSRLWDPEQFSPPLSFATELAATGAPLGVKLGPGIPHELIPADCEAEWTSVDGQLVEVTLWFNALARRDSEGRMVRRAATMLSAGNNVRLSRAKCDACGAMSEATEDCPRCRQATQESKHDSTNTASTVSAAELTSVTDFGEGTELSPAGAEGLAGILWEPDPAVIRAGLVSELCEQMGGRLLDERIAYLTTDDAVGSSLARGYRVVEVMDFSAKRLKRWCTEQGITSVEIKKRGVDVVPEQLRAQILPKKKPRGPATRAVLVITRLGDRRLAAVVEPLS